MARKKINQEVKQLIADLTPDKAELTHEVAMNFAKLQSMYETAKEMDITLNEQFISSLKEWRHIARENELVS
jgi:hypothetical protein